MTNIRLSKKDLVGKDDLLAELDRLVQSRKTIPGKKKENAKRYQTLGHSIRRLRQRIDAFDERMALLEIEKPIYLAHHRGTLMHTDHLGGRFDADYQRSKYYLHRTLRNIEIDELTTEIRKASIAYLHRIDDLRNKLGDPSSFDDEKKKYYSVRKRPCASIR